jgi:hypothetical protein
MRYTILLLKALIILYLGHLLFFIVTAYEPTDPSFHPPLGIFIIDMINLFIHEAGHFFFKLFGRWIYVLAGSVFQILVPMALLAVTWRQNLPQIAYPGFWIGESMVNVSVYIRDAPFKHLKLIGRGLIHDWNWLLSDNLEVAEPLGETIFVMGVLICLASLGVGVYFAVRNFTNPADVANE